MSSLSQKPAFLFKQGDSFEFIINLKDSSGTPLTLDPVAIKSQVRQQDGNLIDTLAVSAGGETGAYRIVGNNTSSYPVGIFLIDFKMNIEGKIISSPTILVQVDKSVTVW